MRHSRAGAHIALWVAVMVATAMVTGRAEGQGLPVRVAIGVRAEVLPLPAPQTVLVDSLQTPVNLRLTPSDTAAMRRARRGRLLVVSYPGT